MSALNLTTKLENEVDNLCYRYLLRDGILKKNLHGSYKEVTDLEEYKDIALECIEFVRHLSEGFSDLVTTLLEEKEELEHAHMEASEYEDRVSELESELDLMTGELNSYEDEIRNLEADLSDCEEECEKLKEELESIT